MTINSASAIAAVTYTIDGTGNSVAQYGYSRQDVCNGEGEWPGCRSFLTILLLLALGPSCARRPEPKYDNSKPNFFESLDSVPIIVVGRLDSGAVNLIGKPFVYKSVPYHPVQLFGVKILVENVLKGGIPKGTADFTYYGAPFSNLPGAMGFYGVYPYRDLLLLRRDDARLRTMTDIWKCCSAPVTSGTHLNFQPSSGQSLPDAVIDLLLTRGEGATDAGMATAIFSPTPRHVSALSTAKALLRLSVSEKPVLRIAACLAFRDVVVGQMPLAATFGIADASVKRWQEEFKENGPARLWWAQDLDHAELPKISPTAIGDKKGISLCDDDQALGVPAPVSLH